ncbi:MAG TPA: glycosyltransferase family 39 protein [Pseudonocardiaceae bacterium]|nr:glycosyltransferase family 39 protein [Pseudonocardiaceae bacterium]
MSIGVATAQSAGAARMAPVPWSRRRSSVLVLLVVAAVVGVLGPLAMAAWTGSLSIPHNDSWAFSKAAQTFARTGHLQLLNWNAMFLVGEFVPLGPLGASLSAQHCYVALLALLSLAAGYDLLRSVSGPRRAALGVLALVIWPGFGLLATSMMTDLPAFAAVAIVLALGQQALRRRSVPLLMLVALVSLWGFTIREQTIAAPVAIFVAALARKDLRRRSFVLALGALGAALAVAACGFELWRRGQPGGSSPSFTATHFPGIRAVLVDSVGAYLMVALILSPLILLAARPWRWSWPTRLASLVGVAVLLTAVLRYHAGFPQNYLEIQGAYPSAFLGQKPNLFPRPVWDVLLPLAVVSGALLAGLLVSRVRRLPLPFLIFGLLTAAGTVVEIVEGQILFDRYLLPLALPVAALTLREPFGALSGISRARVAVAGAGWLFLASVTSLITLNGLVYDAATWHAAHSVVSSGRAAAPYVNAGFTWTAYYSTTGAGPADPNAEPGTYVKTPMFSDDQPCYVVAAAPQTDPQHNARWTLAETPTYRTYGFFGSQRQLFVYRTTATTCR